MRNGDIVPACDARGPSVQTAEIGEREGVVERRGIELRMSGLFKQWYSGHFHWLVPHVIALDRENQTEH